MKKSLMTQVNMYRPSNSNDAFPKNPDSNTQETAIKWASSRSRGYSRGFRISDNEVGDYRLDVVENRFTNPKFIELEIRGQGGRAYKVELEQNGQKFIVDMREDAIIYTMKHNKIEDGIIYGDFAYIPASNMPLVSIHSSDYQNYLKSVDEQKNLEKISMRDLEVGKVYQKSEAFTSDYMKNSGYIYLGSTYSRNYDNNTGELLNTYTKYHKIFRIDITDNVETILQKLSSNLKYIEFIKSVKFVKKCDLEFSEYELSTCNVETTAIANHFKTKLGDYCRHTLNQTHNYYGRSHFASNKNIIPKAFAVDVKGTERYSENLLDLFTEVHDRRLQY